MRVRSKVVDAPSGEQWRVGRLWVSRPAPRWRRVHLGSTASDAAWNIPLPDAGSPEDLATGVLILVGAVVFAVVVIPLLLFGIELIIAGLLIAAGILTRSLFGRPWVVRATPSTGEGQTFAWRVTGLKRSGRVIDEVTAALAGGLSPAPAEHAEPLLAEPTA